LADKIELADVFRMLDRCASGYITRITKHSVLVFYAGKSFALPKGPGIPKNLSAVRQVPVEPARVRKLAQNFGLSIKCVNDHFQGLMRAAPDK
jgi:hypothetical protein